MPRPTIHNLAITIFTLVSFAVFAAANTAYAQNGLDFLNLPPGAEIGDVLSRLYVYGVGVVAIAAMIMLVIGGVQYMVAGEKDPSSAKERIRNAIWGLILALTSYLILYTINPDLTKKVILTPLEIKVVPPPTQSSGGEPNFIQQQINNNAPYACFSESGSTRYCQERSGNCIKISVGGGQGCTTRGGTVLSPTSTGEYCMVPQCSNYTTP